MTKKEQALLSAYENARYTSVSELYARPSFYKTRAEALILKEMLEYGGSDYRVIGGNCFTFSCAYIIDDLTYGKVLRYHTASNVYEVRIREGITPTELCED